MIRNFFQNYENYNNTSISVEFEFYFLKRVKKMYSIFKDIPYDFMLNNLSIRAIEEVIKLKNSLIKENKSCQGSKSDILELMHFLELLLANLSRATEELHERYGKKNNSKKSNIPMMESIKSSVVNFMLENIRKSAIKATAAFNAVNWTYLSQNYSKKNISDDTLKKDIKVMLEQISVLIPKMVTELQILRKIDASNDVSIERKNILLKYGFDIFSYPEIAYCLELNWPLFENVINFAKSWSSARSSNDWYNKIDIKLVVESLPKWHNIIFENIPNSKLVEIRELIIKEHTLDHLESKNQSSSSAGWFGKKILSRIKKTNLLKNNIESYAHSELLILNDVEIMRCLEEALMTLRMIFYSGFYGDKLKVKFFLDMIKTREDLHIVYNYTKKIFKRGENFPKAIIINEFFKYENMFMKNKPEPLRIFSEYPKAPYEIFHLILPVRSVIGSDESKKTTSLEDPRVLEFLAKHTQKIIFKWEDTDNQWIKKHEKKFRSQDATYIPGYGRFQQHELEFFLENIKKQYDLSFEIIGTMLMDLEQVRIFAAREWLAILGLIVIKTNYAWLTVIKEYGPSISRILNKTDIYNKYNKQFHVLFTLFTKTVNNLDPKTAADILNRIIEIISDYPYYFNDDSSFRTLRSLFDSFYATIERLIDVNSYDDIKKFNRLALDVLINYQPISVNRFSELFDSMLGYGVYLSFENIHETLKLLDSYYVIEKKTNSEGWINFIGLVAKILSIAKNVQENITVDFVNKTIYDCIKFFTGAINGNKQKMRLVAYLNAFPDSVLSRYSEYLLYVFETSPKNFLEILRTIYYLNITGSNITPSLIELSRVHKHYRLLSENKPDEQVDTKLIENTYLYFANLAGRTPNLEKLRKNFSKIDTIHEKSAFETINRMLMDSSMEALTNVKNFAIMDAFEKYCGVKIPKELCDDDAMNALVVAKSCKKLAAGFEMNTMNHDTAKEFIRQLCLKNMYPHKKIIDSYPYTDPRNLKFIQDMRSLGLNMTPWVEGMKRTIKTKHTEYLENKNANIEMNINEAIEHMKELGVIATKENIFEEFKKIKDHENTALVQDIKNHLNAAKSLNESIISTSAISEVTVFIELNPLKVLQMGNVVSGSCLNIEGGNSWTTITNAVDINKKVLYAVDKKGNILARRLIAMTDNGKIIQFRTYNNILDLNIDEVFEEFTIQLAEECHAGFSDGKDKVRLLVAERWYCGSAAVPFTLNKKV